MTHWCYLLSYDPTETSPDRLLRELDRLEEAVLNWVAPYAGAVVLVSGLSAGDLTEVLRESTVLKRRQFVLLDTETDRNGWLPRSVWQLMRDPRVVEGDDEEPGDGERQ